MRFLADESCDFGVVLALRAVEHDVAAIAEVSPREEDDSVMERALQEERIVITESSRSFNQAGCGLVEFLELFKYLWLHSSSSQELC